MGRVSIKENKNPYQVRREELGLSREKASEILGAIPPERIEKIENAKRTAAKRTIAVIAGAFTSLACVGALGASTIISRR